MKRAAVWHRISVVAVGLSMIAACASDSDQASQDTFGGQQEVDEALEVPESAMVESTRSTAAGSNPSSTMSPLPESEMRPEGFSTVLVEITKADGEVCEVCLWLADSAEERGQGLMGVTSLGTPEGMAFVWEQPTAGAFFMFQTVTPLSIAWFGADGALVSTADMDPCLSENAADCERFPAGGEFALAIEVFQGDLASIGITDGATARLLPDTEASDCPLR